jgi:hypothetical protein
MPLYGFKLKKRHINYNKLRGLSPRATYAKRQPLVGEVRANF